jgi:ABC-type uncharacterized transport system permease subunit
MIGWWARNRYIAAATVVVFVAGYVLLFLTGVTTTRHLVDNLVAGYLMAWGLFAMLSDLSRAELGKRFILTTATIVSCFVIAESAVVLGMVDYRSVFGTSL